MSHYKPYPAYKESGVEWIGNVPQHWAVMHLGKLATDRCDGPFGSGLKSEHYETDGVRVIRLQNIGWASFKGDDAVFISHDHWSKTLRSGHAVKPNDVLIAGLGDQNNPLGRACVAPTDLGDALVKADCYRFRLHRNRVVPQFVALALSATATAECGSMATGATRDRLNLELASVRRVPLPPHEEQRAIVKVLDRETARIDALIAKKTEFIELLAKKRQALITHAVTKGLNPKATMKDSSVEWIGEVPEHWNVVQVRHVARLGSGHTPSRSRPDWWEDCYIPWFTLADIWQVRREGRRYIFETEETVSDLGIANSSATVHPAGSVVLSRTASVGFPAIMGCDMATSQDFAVWRCGKRLHNEFLYLVLLGMKQELSCLMIGSTHKTIYMPDIEAFRMPLPSVDEQKAIVEHVDTETKRIDRLAELTTTSIDLLKKRRSALITAAVTGQIDLRESA
ncbi:MAG: restriction endonuclease subunit S [Dechloromonas sp.]|nr:restriction endonuclease subunit S [Dechloromonas sp.]